MKKNKKNKKKRKQERKEDRNVEEEEEEEEEEKEEEEQQQQEQGVLNNCNGNGNAGDYDKGKNKRRRFIKNENENKNNDNHDEHNDNDNDDDDDDDNDNDDDDDDNNTNNTSIHSNNNNLIKQQLIKAPAPLEIVPPSASFAATQNQSKTKERIIVLLDQARLETVKTRKGNYELLNCDDHRDLCKKYKKNPSEHRPDICHQELLALIDSPLNKAGYLRVYIKTWKGVLIQVDPSIRIPRTFRRFSGLIVQLLHKMKIKSVSGGGDGGNSGSGGGTKTLMKIIKNPFSQHLPAGTNVLGLSCLGDLYSPMALARNNAFIPDEPMQSKVPPTCLIIGAMATGHVKVDDHPYMTQMISISNYPLSGAAAISRILGAIEHHWGIV